MAMQPRVDELSPERLALLAARLDAARSAPSRASILPRGEARSLAPVAFAQERLWLLEQLFPGTSAYNVPIALRVSGPLRLDVLRRVLTEIVCRHETLRSRIVVDAEGLPRQAIDDPSKTDIAVIDLRGIEALSSPARLDEFLRTEAARPFDLAAGPLFRATILRTAADEHIVLIVMHHAIVDGWSTSVLVNEVGTLYAAFDAAEPSPLPPLPLQYGDFAAWEREQMAGARRETLLRYWRDRLDGASVAELPDDFAPPAIQTFRGASFTCRIPARLGDAIAAFTRREGVSLFMTGLAALDLLLWRYTQHADVLVGTSISHRPDAALERLIGLFDNTLVLRTTIEGTLTGRELLRGVRESTLDAYAHRDLPFDLLVNALQPDRALGRQPLFQVLFVVENTPQAALAVHGLRLEPLDVEMGTTKFDLDVHLRQQGGELALFLTYNSERYAPATIARLVDHYQRLLDGIVSTPDAEVRTLPMLTVEERARLVAVGSGPAVGAEAARSLSERVETQAASTPDLVAVASGQQRLDYRALNEHANRLARFLGRKGVGAEIGVGVEASRALATSVRVLALAKLGATIVPVDFAQPAPRLREVLSHVDVLLLDDGRQVADYAGTAIDLVAAGADIAAESCENLKTRPWPEALAYIIFTSGSTGTPKGIGLPYRALENLVAWHVASLRGGMRTVQFAPLTFDASFHEMFAAWSTGGSLVVVPESLRRDVMGLARFLTASRIDTMILPVVVLQALADEYGQRGGIELPFKEVTTTGEQLRVTPQMRRLFERLGGCPLHNHYGPSETHVITAHTLGADPTSWPALPPIGRPLPNTQLYVLDEYLELVPPGSVGELYAAGACLARGYDGRADLTAAAFIPDPFSRAPGGRMYRTGDVARVRTNGEFDYLGRCDDQVKISGYRVEPGDVEAAVRQHPAVRDAAVLARTKSGRETTLVAYVVLDATLNASAATLRQFLRDRVAEYMMPSAFIPVEAIPTTTNGKVDRRRLLAIDVPSTVASASTYEAPRTPTEQALAAIWTDTLEVRSFGIHESFFDLGGHSLLATQVISRIRTQLHAELPLRVLFEHTTIAALAREIDTRTAGPASAPAAAIPTAQAHNDVLLAQLDTLSDKEIAALLRAAGVAGEEHTR